MFDLTQLLPPSARAAPAGPVAGGSGLNVGVFVLAALVGVLWVLRLAAPFDGRPATSRTSSSAGWWRHW